MIRQIMRSGVTALALVGTSLATGAMTDRFDGAIEHAALAGTLRLDGEVFHVQGLAVDGPRLWVTSLDGAGRRGYLHEFDRASGRFLRRLDLTDGPRFHPGGLSVSGGSIWVPVAENRPDSSATLVQIDAATMRIERRIRVADHIGCVAVSGRHLVAGNWNSRLLYVLDLADLHVERVVPNPSRTRYQDMKFVDGQIVAGGYVTLWSGTVDWLDWPSLRVRRTLRAGALGPVRPFGRGGPYTGEGMAIEGRDLYLLPEDGPSRMFHFRLDTVAGGQAVAARSTSST